MEKFTIVLALLGLILLIANESESRNQSQYMAKNCRVHTACLTQFNATGDGKFLNTEAFKKAIKNLSAYTRHGGALLYVPPGNWLTGPFKLISNFTLYLEKGAVLLASQNESDYELIEALPSYGYGRDGGEKVRYISLISGTNLSDVVITGANGTINGQGQPWWKKFRSDMLKYTRPYLIEIMHSKGVQISNLTLNNSPSWNVHPVYCKQVIIENLTILAPVDSPNTDGINPDSCRNTRIRNCFIVSGDDCIAVKSGWDQYGTGYNKSTRFLSISGLTCISPDSAAIALGSEMSGGIRDVRVDGVHAIHTESAVRMKTADGRGGYVKNIFVKNMKLETMKYVLWMTGTYGQHADNNWNRSAIPVVKNFNYRDIDAKNVTMVGNLLGIPGHNFTGICVSNLNATMAKGSKMDWNCSDIGGKTSRVSPPACELLPEKKGKKGVMDCVYPKDVLAIDEVELETCSF